MNKKILKLMKEKGNNYIFPFLWMHGEDEQTLREYMRVIYDSNIRAVCVESRPHPDFAGPGTNYHLCNKFIGFNKIYIGQTASTDSSGIGRTSSGCFWQVESTVITGGAISAPFFQRLRVY